MRLIDADKLSFQSLSKSNNTCGVDLISRQAAVSIPVLPKEYREYQTMNLDDAYELGWVDYQECIEELPSTQLERKIGKWMKFDSDEDKYDIIKCSHCKHIFTGDSYHWSDIGFVKDDFNFCPNCGAKMERKEE